YWGNDNITGTTGNDVIIGGGGEDKLNGGNGSDQYVYTGYQSNEWNTFEGYDTITDTGTTGTDTIVAKGTGNVDIGLKSFDVNSGIETIDGTGVTGKVTIVGDWSANTLDFSNTNFVGDNIQINGYWGNDNITGTTGNDVIIGGGGEDILIGGLGSDQLTGGEGRDRFIFNTVDEIGQGANQDNILDFNTDLDTIDISAIDANSLNAGDQSFTFIGASDFSGQAGQLRFYGGLLCGDTNGDAVSDFQLAIAGVYSLPVTNIVL
ncbi:calcium-binding protein, partial [Microcystis sp. LE19-195.1E]|uniref:calcium-binding protein n=1 Tax=Microcystis sp. LE19-195.1E TaxID=3016440 RepID=UPI0022C15710